MKLQTLQRTGNALASPIEQLHILQDGRPSHLAPFSERLAEYGVLPLYRKQLTTLQINVGKVCNQTCTHCHVDAGPDRRESMTYETARQVLDFLARSEVKTLDITGGAPEMNPQFRMLVREARKLDKQIIDRCNLTILLANGFTDLPEFLAEQHVSVVASLPCYLEENCDAQRGNGVFVKSIEAIRRLNKLGYAQPNSNLRLDLVYNPTGLGLPPEQQKLEASYKSELDARYGIQFNKLLTITNMPVSRFLDDLLRRGKYEEYLGKLIQSFNPSTIDNLMCRSLLSVDWNGFIYDCDFNQMLDLAINETAERSGPLWRSNEAIGIDSPPKDQRPTRIDRVHISQLTDDLLADRAIRTANHCYGCTAGCGSSCGGSLVG